MRVVRRIRNRSVGIKSQNKNATDSNESAALYSPRNLTRWLKVRAYNSCGLTSLFQGVIRRPTIAPRLSWQLRSTEGCHRSVLRAPTHDLFPTLLLVARRVSNGCASVSSTLNARGSEIRHRAASRRFRRTEEVLKGSAAGKTLSSVRDEPHGPKKVASLGLPPNYCPMVRSQ
jgi:hypothetical protein